MGLKWKCPADQNCSTWALSYVLDCICNRRDIVSFLLGISSILCWAVTELPQIVINWRSTNVEGVSLAFMFLWMMGDISNLMGCWISPGTLPTQLYLAALYSAASILLVGQQVRSSWISYRASPNLPSSRALLRDALYGRSDARHPRSHNDSEGLLHSDPTLILTPSTQSLPVTTNNGGERPSLPASASLPVRPSCPQPEWHTASSLDALNNLSPTTHSMSWRRLILSNSYGASGSPATHGLIFSSLVIVGVTLSSLSPFEEGQGFRQHGTVSWVGGERRQLLQGHRKMDLAESVGLVLGWLMTCIYLTGRLPQFVLNWSRDTVIGVSGTTVFFAFLGNATYLGSILVRGVEWHRLKPVLPWVLDVACCLFMDFIMVFQFLIRSQREGYPTLD